MVFRCIVGVSLENSEIEKIINFYNLKAHPEGGFYARTYTSEIQIPQNILGDKFYEDRASSSAIVYLLRKGERSHFHKIASDELWHFYAGSSLRIVEISNNGEAKETILGPLTQSGAVFQYCVKAGTYFAATLYSDGDYSFVGCTVSPAFDFQEFKLPTRKDLVSKFPLCSNLIEEFTKP